MKNPTIREIIEELEQFPEDIKDEEITSIGTYSGLVEYRYSFGTRKGIIDFGRTKDE